MKTPWKEGEDAYLVPTLPSAPTAAYKLPKVTVVTVFTLAPRLLVQLADGTQIETDQANVRRTRPEPPVKPPALRPRRPMPEGFAEVPLWD